MSSTNRIGWIGFRFSGNGVGGMELKSTITEALLAMEKVDHKDGTEYFLCFRDVSSIRMVPFTKYMDRFCYELAYGLAHKESQCPISLTGQYLELWLKFYAGWISEDVYTRSSYVLKTRVESSELMVHLHQLLETKRSLRVQGLFALLRSTGIFSAYEIEREFVQTARGLIPDFERIWGENRVE